MTDTITLTNSQQQALEKLKQFVKSNQQHFRLTGYAGTGKSFLMAQFMRWLLSERLEFIAASPTNKAAKNLKKIGLENNIDFEVTTVAKLLGQQPQLNKETGKEEFVTGDSTIGDYNVVIFDEFSMINQQNFEDIVCEVYAKKTKIIYVGDSAQLPPVGEKFPVIANHPYIKSEGNLTEVVRYDGDIAHVSEQIRIHSFFNQHLYPFQTTKDETIICLQRNNWLDKAGKFFCSEDYKINPNYVRFLTWRNKTAAMLNDFIRGKLWGDNVPAYVIGDRLIAKVPVFRPNPHKSSHTGKEEFQIIINSSEEVEVIGKAVQGRDKNQGWDYWEVPVKTEDGLNTMLRLLTEDGEEKRQKLLKSLKQNKKWKQYYYYLKLYDNMPFAYAITTHKAQGSSIDYCFVDVADMRHCPDLQKILYTALTRAKKTAFIPQ